MLDTLDLKTLIKEGQHYRSVERRITRRSMILAGIILVIIAVAWFMGNNRPASLYQMTASGWVGHQLSGNPVTVNVSDTGVVWTQTQMDHTLYRYADSQWTGYDIHEIFGEETWDYLEIDSHGDEVWAAAQNKIAHFDGSTWQTLPTVLSRGTYISSIVAGSDGVYMVDGDASVLIHYTNEGEWSFTTAPMLPALLPDASPRCNDIPTAYEGTDGTLWLTYCGLWRYSAPDWEKVNDLPVTRLYSATADRVYLYDYNTSEMVVIDLTDSAYPTTTYTAAELGLLDDMPVMNMVEYQPGTVWISSYGTTVSFDGNQATPVTADDAFSQHPPIGFASNSQGALWYVSYDFRATQTSAIASLGQSLIAGLLGPLALFLVYHFSYSQPRNQLSNQRTKIARDLLPYIVDDFKQYIPQDEPAEKSGSGQGCLTFLMVIGISLFNQSQGITGLADTAIFVVVFFLFTNFRDIGKALDRSLDAETLRYHRKSLLVNAAVILVSVVLIDVVGSIFMNVINTNDVFSPVNLIGLIFVPLAALYVFWRYGLGSIHQWMLRPALHGKYKDSLARIERFKNVMPWLLLDPETLRAIVLLLKGEGQAAKELWATRLVELQNSGADAVASALHNLSEALEVDGHHEEALPLLEGMAKIAPDNPKVYQELAQHYLDTHTYPERALAMTDAMLLFMDQRKLFAFETEKRSNRASNLAIRAWSLAEVERFAEAKALLLEAKRQNHGRYALNNAFLLRVQGNILLRWGKPREALKALKKAEQADPQGGEGRLARLDYQKLRQSMSPKVEQSDLELAI